MSDDNVTKLPVRFRKPLADEGRIIQEADPIGACRHQDATYLIGPGAADVECSKCGTRLDPMWVLRQLARHDSRMHSAHSRYHEEMKRLSERTRTKCENCGQMTRISRR